MYKNILEGGEGVKVVTVLTLRLKRDVKEKVAIECREGRVVFVLR